MISSNKNSRVPLVILALLFVAFTLLVMTVDVRPIGPEGSMVGFSSLNGAFRDAFKENLLLYEITEYLGIAAILVLAAWGASGLFQWIKRKHLLKVDPQLLAFGITVILVLICYVFFEIFVVNMRPILGEDGLEASYPSSHTMLALSVFSCSLSCLKRYITKKPLRVFCCVLVLAAMALMIFGRLFCGVHWLTDIVGSVLLSAALYEVYLYLSCILCDKCKQ